MLPLLAIAGANIARNLIQPVAAQMLSPTGQPKTEATDPAAFQKLLQKVSSSPEVQKASFLASEGIRDTADAQTKLADFGARILQDPEVQKAVAGSSGAVEMRFSPDGSVAIKTADGRVKTVHPQGDAKEAAQKAAHVLAILQPAAHTTSAVTTFKLGTLPQMPGITITPGASTATVLA
jgi:hypothetical protein